MVKNVTYPNRLGGLVEFASETGEAPSTLPTKGESMRMLLEQIKQTIIQRSFG